MEGTKDLKGSKVSNNAYNNRKAAECLRRLIIGNLPNMEIQFSYQAKMKK